MNIILHIPHSSTMLPHFFYKKTCANKNIIKKFNYNITDLYTNELFGKNKYKKIIFKYSRIFCDVEKFADDDKEIMSSFGMGYVYTSTNLGVEFLKPTKDYKEKIFKKYYTKHHRKLDNIVGKSLKKQKTILIDCHSFSKDIIMFKEKKQNLPDICLGFEEIYYNEKIINFIKSFFEKLGYKVQLNYPYSGAIIPNKFLNKINTNLFCVMIEVNKNIYLNKNNTKNNNFEKLTQQIQSLLTELKNLK